MLNPLTHRKILKKGMPGRATIVEMGALDRGGTSFNLPMTLQVHVEGITPFEVEDQWMVKAKDCAGLSGSIPVKVDRDDHQKVAIDWDGVRAAYEQEKAARREALASGAPPGVSVTMEDSQVIDLSDNPELMRQVEQALGQFGMQMPQGASAGFSGPQAEGDDPIAKLERLAALRAAGVLTEEEFQQQKRRVLGET
jgi:putative oligomerization/nucleic acid binding protein